MYVALSECQDEIQEVAISHGWDLSGVEIFTLSSAQQLVNQENQNTVFRTATVELTETESLLRERIKVTRPARVVIDSLSEFRLLAAEPWVYRQQLLRLKDFLTPMNVTALFLEATVKEMSEAESIVHGVIRLSFDAPESGNFRRHLCVQKLRGVAFLEGNHDIALRTEGMEVFPRLIAADLGQPETTPQPPLASGITALDELLGGGLDCGASTLIIGPAGVGKSTIAMQFAMQAADLGMKSQCYGFEERNQTTFQRWDSLGRDLRPYVEKGLIMLYHIDPAEISAGEFGSDIRRGVEADGVKVVIIDSLTGFQQAMVGEHTLKLQLHELQTYLGNHGVTTIIIDTQHGLFTTSASAGQDVSYLADTVLLLRYYEFRGTIRKALSALKRRGGQHETAIRDFELGAGGIVVGRPLTEFSGVLSGSPVYISTQTPFGSKAP